MHDNNTNSMVEELPVNLIKDSYGGVKREVIESIVSATKELSGPIALYLFDQNITNAFESVKLTQIQSALSQPGVMSKLSRTLRSVPSITDIYKSIGLMKTKGVVKLGAKVGNSNKFFLTDLGILVAEYLSDCIEEAANREIMRRRDMGLSDYPEDDEQ